jgi:outer membrane immunogenic protein
MKKRIIICLLTLLITMNLTSQNTMKDKLQINAGFGLSNYGLPLYGGFDYGIMKDLSVGGELSFRSHSAGGSNLTLIGIGGNVNYHFNTIFKIKDNHWDVYGGGTLAYWVWNWDKNIAGFNTSGIGLSAQIGGRYFFTKNWAANLELGGGTLSGGKIGVTYRL